MIPIIIIFIILHTYMTQLKSNQHLYKSATETLYIKVTSHSTATVALCRPYSANSALCRLSETAVSVSRRRRRSRWPWWRRATPADTTGRRSPCRPGRRRRQRSVARRRRRRGGWSASKLDRRRSQWRWAAAGRGRTAASTWSAV